MTSIDEFLEKAEEHAKEADKCYRGLAPQGKDFAESIRKAFEERGEGFLGNITNYTDILKANFHATMANYYCSRALIESKK